MSSNFPISGFVNGYPAGSPIYQHLSRWLLADGRWVFLTESHMTVGRGSLIFQHDHISGKNSVLLVSGPSRLRPFVECEFTPADGKLLVTLPDGSNATVPHDPCVPNFASRKASDINLPAVGTQFIGPDGAIVEFVEVSASSEMWSKYEEETWSCWIVKVIGFVEGSKGATDGFAGYRTGKTASMDPRRLNAR